MQKTQAVAALGQRRLMLPGWVKAALSANDQLKVHLTVLQSARMRSLSLTRLCRTARRSLGSAR